MLPALSLMVFESIQKVGTAVPDWREAESGPEALPGWVLLPRTELQILLLTLKTVMVDGGEQGERVLVVGQDSVLQAPGCVDIFPPAAAALQRGRAEDHRGRGGAVLHLPSSARHH